MEGAATATFSWDSARWLIVSRRRCDEAREGVGPPPGGTRKPMKQAINQPTASADGAAVDGTAGPTDEVDGEEDEHPRRFFFVHVMKTGGTTVFRRLGGGSHRSEARSEYPFTPEEIYPNASDGDTFIDQPHIQPRVLFERWAARSDEIRCVMGHLPFGVVGEFGAPFTTLTVLRDPVERTLSYLRHRREHEPDQSKVELEAIYDDPDLFSWCIHNHMVKMLGCEFAEVPGGMYSPVEFRREHLERAKQVLTAIDVVGLQDQLEDFMDELNRRFGWDVGPPLHGKPNRAGGGLWRAARAHRRR